MNRVMSKKLLAILLTFALSLLSVNMTGVSAQLVGIGVSPSSVVDLEPGTEFTVAIYTDYPGSDIWGYELTLSFNPSVIHGVSVTNGDLIANDTVREDARFILGTFNNTEGTLSQTSGFFYYISPSTPGTTPGPGTLAYVTFTVVAYGVSTITIGPESKLKGYNIARGHYDITDAEIHPDRIQHGYFQNVPDVTHDIAVFSVTPSPTSVVVGWFVDITVVVENQGNVNEAFNVTAYANDTAIETKTVTNLGSGTTKSLTFAWDTTGADLGTYTIKALASIVTGETDTDDNTLVSGQTVTVSEPVNPPVAIITVDETAWYVNETIIFSGESSYDEDGGTIIAYEWDFDDGTTATGMFVTHAYNTIGTYTVALVVTDSQNQVGSTSLTISIEEIPSVPPAYAADLVKWKAKPEAHSWDYSKDVDKNVTLTALAGNLGTKPVSVTVTFAIFDAKHGTLVPPVIVENATLAVPGEDVPVSVLLDPRDYGYTGTKIVLFAHVTLEYYDAGTESWIPASTKIVKFAVVP